MHNVMHDLYMHIIQYIVFHLLVHNTVEFFFLFCIPQKSAGDASNFDDDFTFQPAKLTEPDPQLVLSIDQMNFAGFSFTADRFKN